MNHADQLARIAAVVPPDTEVRIYEVDKGNSTWCWLCPRHLELRKAIGYEVKASKPAPHKLTCDDRNRGPCS